MDILKTIGDNRKYTFHSHTQFCDGRADMYDFVVAAIEAGFENYGFSPHSPVPIVSPCSMSKDNVTDYFNEVSRLREMFGDRINLFAGMEIDYLGPDWGPATDYFTNLPLDYRIGSVHFLPAPDGEIIDIDGRADRFIENMSLHFRDDIRYVVEKFYTSSAEMLEAGHFDILGHFDKIAQNASVYMPGIEDLQWYQSLVDDFIDLICDKKPVVEVNTKAKVLHDRIFPSERYLPRLIEAGVPLIVNSDAHVPTLIDASRDYAFGVIDKLTACRG